MFNEYKEKKKKEALALEEGARRAAEAKARAAEMARANAVHVDLAVNDLLKVSKKQAPCEIMLDKPTLIRTFKKLGPSERYEGTNVEVQVAKVTDNMRKVTIKVI